MVSVHGATVHRPTSIRYLSPDNIFFIESNCFPLHSLFFQQLSYLMYDVHAKTAPKSLLDTFAKINTKHHYNTRLSSCKIMFLWSNSLELKKWKNLLLELLCLFGILFHFLLRLLTYLIFVKKKKKKIKSLLLNVLGNEDNYLNANYLIECFMKLTWYVVYTSSCNFSLFQITKSPVLEFICKVFLSVCYCISFLFFFLM